MSEQPANNLSPEQNETTLRSRISELEAQLCHFRQKARFFDGLMENTVDCIHFKNSESRFLRVNRAWAKRRNLADENEATGKTDYDFFPKELADNFRREDREVIEKMEPIIGKTQKIELPNEEPRWISITKFPLMDSRTGEVLGTCGISHDISAATHTEEELAHERDMLHMLLDHSRDAIYFKDLESRYLRISRAHPAMQLHFIDSPDQAIGKTDYDYFPIEHAQEAFDDEMSIIATGEPVLGIVERETAPGVPEKWVFTSKHPMRDKEGNIIGTFGISRDITQIKKYEDELQKTKSELEERVRLRTQDLVTANTDLERRIAQLDFLTAASYEMAGCVGIYDLATVIINLFSSLLKPSAACLCIKKESKFICIGATGILSRNSNKTVAEQTIPLLATEDLARPTLISGWADLLPHSPPWSEMYHLRCCIAVPLIADNRHVGILQLFAGEETQRHFEEEEKVILTLAAHAAVSLSNAIYYKELGEKAQLQGELDAARSIQQRLTPSYKPMIPRISLKGLYSPAYEVGGDYLDYFKNDVGCWIVVIADVCGKGIPAALLMTLLRSAFRFEARNKTSAKHLLCSVNDSMRTNLDDRSFVTAVCLVINPDGTSMSYARAGHPRLIRIRAENNRVETFDSDGIALGILPEAEAFERIMTELTIPLNEGDRFFIYTDGLTDAYNLEKSPYSTKRLLSVLESNTGSTPESLVNTIIQDIRAFTQGAPYHDDLTLVAMKVGHNGHGKK